MPERVKLAAAVLWLQAVIAAVIAAQAHASSTSSFGLPRRLPDGSKMPAPLQDQIIRTMLLELGRIVTPLAVALIVGAVAVLVRRSWARWLAIGGELPLLFVSLLALSSGLDQREPSSIMVAMVLIGGVILVLRPLSSKAAAAYYSGGSSPDRMSSASTMR